VVQEEEDVGVNDDGFLRLRDANATYPHQSGVAWEEGMGADKGWKAAVGLKCAADPPPATLVLSGELERQGDCLGVYVLEAGRTAHGRAVWRHERGDQWIAKDSDGNWVVQEEEDVGVNDDGFLRLRDANATYPHQSGVAWEEGMGGDKGWKAAAGLKCAADPPPATLVLSGELEHQGDCLGVYVLEAGRTAHGRAVWRHEREVTDEVIILFSAVHFDVGVTLSRAQFL